jgi:hypothetical protein
MMTEATYITIQLLHSVGFEEEKGKNHGEHKISKNEIGIKG